jgi:hypothetical protein
MSGPTYVLRSGGAELADLVDGEAVYGYPGANYPNRRYYVNNITGSSTNDGQSWTTPMDEPSTAITAWEAYRATLTSNNQNVRGQIFVQGTATAYSAITALPSYCDLIGVGAGPQGNGAGIPRIGADSGTGEHGMNSTGSYRGLYISGFQFQAGASGYAFKVGNLFRSTIENCVFASNGSPKGQPAAGVQAAIFGGVVMKDCLWLNQSSSTNIFTRGMYITGTHFHGSIVQNCHISGTTAAVHIASTVVNGWASRFQWCTFDGGGGTCAIDVIDDATTGFILFVDCNSYATTNYDMANDGANRVIRCYAANALVTAS